VREKPAVRRALIEQADELRSFKDIATLRIEPLQRPPDAPTDYARGAAAVRALGMNRLGERLEKAAGQTAG
jgi:DNA polymerase-1